MKDPRASEYAIAIRMTCSNPDVSPGSDTSPVVVTFRAGATVAEDAEAVLIYEDAIQPPVLADALAASLVETGRVPDSVGLKDLGVFTIREPRRGGGRARLTGLVALVTGGAQGFGRGIAAELAHEGAYVVIADINEPLGRAAVDELNDTCGADTAIFCKTDVTDAASLTGCVTEAVQAFGGVDMYVSNAGVLQAGAIEEMDEGSFDLVTRVNYKAYFLGVKAAVPVMRLQHRFNPHHLMDIVEINSKSGLQGSARNFAYAGGKFGGIGLTQSFALELVADNIRVNAVCPGNYFEGPLWSDPQNGLLVQYLEAGKVPGAESVEDVRNHYLSKVPMQRGCTPRDVARAIFYLHEQEYETGQALPVTGGQIMLR
jgi:NAD(P)-dependent dehydrogenase (short-subunit alcohol dehydrogenase family)